MSNLFLVFHIRNKLLPLHFKAPRAEGGLRIFLLISLLSFAPYETFADPWKSLKQGDQAAKEFLNTVDQKKAEAGPHPFYDGKKTKEENLKDGALEGSSKSLIRNDPASQMVRESHENRPEFKIDVEHDPLITRTEQIGEEPLTAIGGEGTQLVEVLQGGTNEIFVCEEAGDDAIYTCHLNLLVTVKEEAGPIQQGSSTLGGPAIYSSYGYLLNHWPRERSRHFVGYIQVDPSTLKAFISNQTNIPVTQITTASTSPVGEWVRVRHKHYTFEMHQFNYSYQPRIKVPYYSWIDGCTTLEAKVDQGHCFYVSKVCTQGPQTRIIDGVSITRDCWQYTLTYACSYPSKNDCGPLRARGCAQINSTCKKMVGKSCVVYNQTYECKGPSQTTYKITGGQTPFCLDGNCRDQGWEANDEMMSSLAQLAILKEMQGLFESKEGFFKGG